MTIENEKEQGNMSATQDKQALVEKFLNRAELSSAERAIKDKAVDTDQKVANLRKELNEINTSLQSKNAELISLSGQLEGMIELMATIASSFEEINNE